MYFLESLSLLLLSMDKFVVRELKKDPHLAVNKSAKDRAALALLSFSLFLLK